MVAYKRWRKTKVLLYSTKASCFMAQNKKRELWYQYNCFCFRQRHMLKLVKFSPSVPILFSKTTGSKNCLHQLSNLFNYPEAARLIWHMTTTCGCLEKLHRAGVPGCPCMSAAGWWRCRPKGTPRCPDAAGCGSARRTAPCRCTAPEPYGSHSGSSLGNTGCERISYIIEEFGLKDFMMKQNI